MARVVTCLFILLALSVPGAISASDVISEPVNRAPEAPAGAKQPARSHSGWSTDRKDGVYWLKSPDGKLFYSKGVNFIDGGKDNEKSCRKEAYYCRNFYPSLEAWHWAAGKQLTSWGFNTRGGWSDPSRAIPLALTVDLELGRNSKFHWFDPFDPSMEKTTMEGAKRLTAPYRDDPQLLGYFSDNEVGWWNSPLFEWYLGKGWDNFTKRVLWQLLYDHYGGEWERLLEDWVPEGRISSFADLKNADAKLRLRPGGRGIRLVDRFMYLCTQRYYRLMHDAIRQAHPGALILGDRLPLYYHQDAVLAMGDNVDVISTNYNVDVPDGWVAPYYFDGLRRLIDKPVLITEFFFAAAENRTGNRNETARSPHPKPGHLMTVASQAERARGVAGAIRNFARFPNVVGAHWFQYCDEPLGGREDGEDYNMGLIDTANRPYEEVTNVFSQINPNLEALHQQSVQLASERDASLVKLVVGPREKLEGASADTPSTPVSNVDEITPLRRASSPIDVTDQSLMDWDKAETRLVGFQAPEPYVPFGDVHLTWTPEGIYLASLANTYVDPKFLAYRGEFPVSEAFQLHLMVETDGHVHHYAIYLVPEPNPALPDGFDVVPRLYRYEDGKQPELLSISGRAQRLNKSLPHMALEAFFSAEDLGLKRLEPGMKLRMNIVLTSYYRELSMAWSGGGTMQDTQDPHTMRTVVLRSFDEEKRIPASLVKN